MRMTRQDVERRIAARAPGDEIDLRGADLTGADLSGMNLERVLFGRGREERNPARLHGVSFRGGTLRECSLTRCDLTEVDLRQSTLEDCDLRYITTARTTFGDAALRGCDLYRAYLDAGTVFSPRELRNVSLTNASLNGVTGFAPRHVPDGALAQLDAHAYRDFLERTRADSPEDLDRVVAGRFHEAAGVYRTLSGLWASTGAAGDSGWAYARSRVLERRDASPRHRSTPTRWPRWIGMLVAEAISGYGIRLERVLAALAVVALLPALIYAAAGGVRDAGKPTQALGDCILFSVGQLTTATPERLSPANLAVEWTSTVQTLLGIALLGLFGFVLGNVIRSS